ncbi:hypothetical protein NDU88_006322 [Pleurodeles waltl]|uniref:Reverse transcriptase n=1 Tax=Pleurodeles waltl TaxID=8319 RepID=A0AAV7LQ70_PLEWA|nr:hypothetical protein NDU88_006322 [Pleurodeles waltl]
MRALEETGLQSCGDVAQRQLQLIQQQYQQLLPDDAKKAWQAAQGHIYQWGDKSSRMLHRLCQATHAVSLGPMIRNTRGELLSSPREVAQSFAAFNSELYARRDTVHVDQITEFVQALPLHLSDTACAELDDRITEGDLAAALAEIRTGKAPGPKGFLCKFLKYAATQETLAGGNPLGF